MALHRFARNTLFATLAGVSTALGSFLGSIIVARTLGPTGAGAVAFAIWLAGTTVTVGDLGLPLTISRFVPDLRARGQSDAARAFAANFLLPLLLTTAFGLGVAVALYVGSDAIERRWPDLLPFQGLPAATWLAVGSVFTAQAIGNFGLATLRGEQRFGVAAKVSIVAFGLQIAAIVAGCLSFGVDGALTGYAVAALLPACFAFTSLRQKAPLAPDLRRRAWTFALDSWAAGIVSTVVWSRSELAFLSFWRGHEEAGYYAVAITLAMLATQVPLLMTGSLLALFSERHARGDREGLERAFGAALRFMTLLLFPACFGMAAIVPSLLPLLFGPGFEAAIGVAAFLVAAQAFGAISSVSSTLLFATERSRFLVQIGVWGAAALLIAGFTIIPAFGLLGAAMTRALIQIALAGTAFLFIRRKLAFTLPLRSLLRITAAAVCSALAAHAIVMILPGLFGVCLAIVTGVATYAAALRWFGALQDDDVSRLSLLTQRLPPPIAARLRTIIAYVAARTAASAIEERHAGSRSY